MFMYCIELVKLFKPAAILICPNFNIQQVAAERLSCIYAIYIIKVDEKKDIKNAKLQSENKKHTSAHEQQRPDEEMVKSIHSKNNKHYMCLNEYFWIKIYCLQ